MREGLGDPKSTEILLNFVGGFLRNHEIDMSFWVLPQKRPLAAPGRPSDELERLRQMDCRVQMQ